MTELHRADLFDLTMNGVEFRHTETFEYLGAETEVTFAPIPDKIAVPLQARLHSAMDMEVEEARDHLEDHKEEYEGEINVEALDEDYVQLMVDAAEASLSPGDEPGSPDNGWDEGQLELILENTMNGLIVELGMTGLEVSGTMEDAEAFR